MSFVSSQLVLLRHPAIEIEIVPARRPATARNITMVATGTTRRFAKIAMRER